MTEAYCLTGESVSGRLNPETGEAEVDDDAN